MVSSLSIKLTTVDGVCVVALGSQFERIGDDRIKSMERELTPVLDAAEPAPVLLDLSSTRFFGSSFVAFLFRLQRRMQDQGARACGLAGLSENCAEVIAVTQLDKLWQVFETVDSGVSALSEG